MIMAAAAKAASLPGAGVGGSQTYRARYNTILLYYTILYYTILYYNIL